MVFFDLDGTLLDSNGIWLDIDIAFLGRHGISPVPEDYTWYVTHHSAPDSARYTRERFGLAETAEEIQGAWLDMAREAYAGQLALKPGVRAFLEQCREHGVPMAVLTSCIPELCRAALAHHGILDWFQGVVYAQETGIGKGEPELYRLAADRWGRAPEKCILFEDSPGYCAAAREAGLPCSQQEVRRILAGLDRAGLVRVSRGRGGTRLTPAGRALCRRQAVEGGAEMV